MTYELKKPEREDIQYMMGISQNIRALRGHPASFEMNVSRSTMLAKWEKLGEIFSKLAINNRTKDFLAYITGVEQERPGNLYYLFYYHQHYYLVCIVNDTKVHLVKEVSEPFLSFSENEKEAFIQSFNDAYSMYKTQFKQTLLMRYPLTGFNCIESKYE